MKFPILSWQKDIGTQPDLASLLSIPAWISRYRTEVLWSRIAVVVPLPIAAAGCLLGACSLTKVPDNQDAFSESPKDFDGTFLEAKHEPHEWWKLFNDPALDQVVETVLGSNLDLVGAVARVEQARAKARIANAARFPVLQPYFRTQESDTPSNAGIGSQLEELGLDSKLYETLGLSLPERLGLTNYIVGGEFSYEASFWGRNYSVARSAKAEHLASEFDYWTVHIGVISETVGAYLEIVDLRLQQRLMEELVGILEELELLLATRYERGLSPPQQVYAARTNLREAEAGLIRIERQLADAKNRLWILSAGYQPELESILPNSFPITTSEPVPMVDIPANLLAQRPDVGSARQRMAAASHLVGSRRAELLPSLSLAGTIGLQSADPQERFDPEQWFRNLAVNLVGPAIQGARLRNNLALAKAQLNEASATYARAVITAVVEAKAALSNLEASRRQLALLASKAEEARFDKDLHERRYLSGLGDYETFLISSQVLLSAKSELVSAQRDYGFALLALHRAVGGGYTEPSDAAIAKATP